MEVLCLGGTRFLGRHLVEALLARGHSPTLFHRGRTGAELFPEVPRIIGDRAGDLSGLDQGPASGRWDAVVDTCGYLPRLVRASAERLRDRAERCLFVSSISVYADADQPGLEEDARLATLAELGEPEDCETVTGETYGPLKALCEQAVTAVFGDRALNLRPGFIVGPHDPTGRFTWWLERIRRGGRFLAPGPRSAPMQWIDVRDLAAFMVRLLEAKVGGELHVSGPLEPLTTAAAFAEIAESLQAEVEPVWVAPEVLAERELYGPPMPLAMPASHAGLMAVSLDRARSLGLTLRPRAETYRDTLEHAPPGSELGQGLDAEREARLLDELA